MAEASGDRRLFWLAAGIVAAITLVRIAVLILSPLQLYPDEAQYWWWAQTPSFGYFSKPPLIAWIIGATTFLFGDREWAVRIAIPVLHGVTALVIFAIGRGAFPKETRIAFWSALAYLTLPGVSYSSGLASTDPPLLFFWSIALVALLRALDARDWRWATLCGMAFGAGMLAKYAMLYFVLGVGVAAIASAPVRALIFSRRGIAGMVIAAVLIAPNMIWNASHEFATLMHTEANANWGRAAYSPVHLLAFSAGQFGVFGPLLMVAWVAGIWRIVRERERSGADIVLAALSAVPFLIVAAQSFISNANANWAATAYLAAVPIAVAEMFRWRSHFALWLTFGLNGLVMMLLAVCLIWPPVADRLRLGNVFKREEGWHEMSTEVATIAHDGQFAVVATENRSVLAELLYYTRPHGPNLRIWDEDAASRNHFDMTMRLMAPAPRVLLVVVPQDAPEILTTFDSVRLIATVATPADRKHIRVVRLYDARAYRGPSRRA